MRLGMGLGLGNLLSGNSLIAFPNEYSFNFDGANDDLNIGTSSAPTGNFTISCWAYSTGQGDAQDNALYYGDGLTAFIAINTTGNYVQTYIGGASGGAKTANSTITQNQWHHIAVTWDGSNTKIYIDGDDKSLTGNGAGNPVSATTYIGGKPSGDTNQFKGYLDEVAIWHTALDATTIGKISSKVVDLTKYSASNLKLWLRCGDKAEPESTTSIARSDFSAELDGSNDYVDLGSATFLTHSNSFTISAWVKKTGQPSSNVDTNDNPTIISQGNIYFTIFVNYDGMLGVFFYNSSNASIYTIKSADGAISLNTWHHVALTWDSTSSQLYVDGVSVYSGSVTPYNLNTGVNGTATRIGSHASGGQSYWNGVLSSLSVHKTTFPANDIALMAKSRFTPTRDYMLKQVDFDGVNDYIDCGDLSYMDGVTQITITGWAKRLESNDRVTFEKSTGTNDRVGLNLDTNGVLYANLGTGSAGRWAYASLSGTDWNHIAMVYDGTQGSNATKLNIYINGVKPSTTHLNDIPSTTASTSGTFKIGRAINDANYSSTGSVVGVAVYSDAKDADFIYTQYAKGLFADWSADTNLIGYWKMGNGTGDAFPTIVDQSSNSNNGTITNGASDDIVENMVAGYDLGSFRGSEELGGEIITNSTFDSNVNNWAGSNFAGDEHTALSWQSSGAMRISPNQADSDWRATQATQDIGDALSSSKIYKLVIVAKSNTTRKLRVGSTVSSTGVDLYNSNDTGDELTTEYKTFTAYFVGSTDDIFIGTPHPNGWHADNSTSDYIDVDSISIKEVVSSAVDDTKNAIIDVSNPVLGVDIIGTWVNNGYNTLTVSTSTISSGVSDGSGNDLATSPFTAVSDKLYKLNINLTLNSGTAPSVFIADDTSGTTSTGSTSQVLTSGENNIYWFGDSGATRYVTIKNASTATNFSLTSSIKQVQGNVGKPTSMDATNFPYTSVLPDQSFLTGNSSSYNYFEGDSADEFIDCGTGLASLLGDSYSGKLSVSIWFNQDQTNNTDGFFYIGSHADSNGVWALYMANTSGLFRLRQNSSSSTEMDISNFTSTYTGWVNVLSTWDGATTTAKLYVNGSLVATDTSMASSINFDAEKTIIGSYFSGSFAINGKVSGTGIWTVDQGDNALAIYNLGRQGNLLNKYSDNLIGFYDIGALDAETGIKNTHTRILDRSGNAFHGSVTSGASSDVVTAPNAQPEGYDIESITRKKTTP